MDLGIRKKDLADRLQLLMRETASTVELAHLLLKSCERIVDEVCDTDRSIFLSQYPVVIKFLDSRIHHALQFNCVTDNLISQDIKYENEGVSIIEANNAAGDASQPPQPKLSEIPYLGVASNRGEGDRRPVPPLSEQPSSCINVITHTSNPSQDNAVSVLEGANKTGYKDFGSHVSPDTTEGFIKHQEQQEESQSSSNQFKAQNGSTNESDKNKIQKPIPSVKDINSKKHNAQPIVVPESHLDKTAVDKLSTLGHKTQNTAPQIVDSFLESVYRPIYVGEECAVMLSYIETPGEFYVHIACEENTTLDEFQEEMNAFYNKHEVTLKTKAIAKTRLGNFCVCFQSEVGWCRAEILDWCLDEEHIEVQLVDYGDICLAYLDLIQPILPEYSTRPLYATRCHLAFIEPPPPNDTWPPESAKVFNCYMPPTNKPKLIQDATTLIQDIDVPRVYTIVKAENDVMHISCKENKVVHRTSISVILRDDSDSNKLTMNDYLVDLGYAGSPAIAEDVDLQEKVIDDIGLKRDKHNIVISDRKSDVENWVMNSLDSQSQLDKGKKLNVIKSDESLVDINDMFKDWDPMKEDYLDPSESRENAVLAVSGYDAQDEKRVCKFFAKNGSCYKGIHCRMEHSFAYQDGYSTDKELVYTHAFTPLSMPAEGSVIRITVTHVPKGKNFFCSIIPSDVLSSQPEFEEETLATLNKHLNEPKNIKTFSHLQIPPGRGQMVLAFSKTDSSWHRARVVEELDDSNDTIEVVFVDSGKTETIYEKNLRAIHPSMLHLPFQAIVCHLANVDIDNLSKASEYFQALCLGRTLIAKVIKSLEEVQVMYCLLLDTNGKDMGQLLIQAGLGYEKASNSQLIIMPL